MYVVPHHAIKTYMFGDLDLIDEAFKLMSNRFREFDVRLSLAEDLNAPHFRP